MTGNELHAVDMLIESRLAADPALVALLGGAKVYQETAPQTAAEPYIVYNFVSSPDVNTMGAGQRLYTRPLYVVQAVTKTNSFASAVPMNGRIDALLMGASGAVIAENAYISSVGREEPVRYVETTDAGTRLFHLGGRYRFFVSAN